MDAEDERVPVSISRAEEMSERQMHGDGLRDGGDGQPDGERAV